MPGKPFQPIVYEHFSLMGQIISYEQNKILSQVSYSQGFLFLYNLPMGPISERVGLGKFFHPRVCDHSSLLGQFISCKQNEVL